MIQGEFKAASMDSTAKTLTVLIILMAGAFPFLPDPPVYGVLLLPLIILLTWLFSVTAYTIDSEKLIVHRPLWNTIVILPPGSVARFEPEIAKGLWRTWGNGGMFGYTGRFKNKALGNFAAYATSWRHAVSITSDTVSFAVVITPENPMEVLQGRQ
jgi:hypothetical protein